MPEVPSEPPGARAEPARVAPAGAEDAPRRDVPRPVVKADLLPAASTLSLIALLGLPLGWAWSRLAPPKQTAVTGDGNLSSVLVESYHEFDALGVFLLLSFGIGVVTAVALWMRRNRRGPVFLLAGVLGSALAAWLGNTLGTGFAQALYPVPNPPPGGGLVTVPPEVTTPWAVLAQPLAIALVYGLAASWNGLDDLGRRRAG